MAHRLALRYRDRGETLEDLRQIAAVGPVQRRGPDVRLGDTLGADDDAFGLVLDREAARDGIGSLAEREKRVLYLRFFAGMTQRAIAAELGISQIHVSRPIAESCRRIREDAECADL
ncbi:sigma factor-like helix-turn-helix DNA-binding protein [Streptomyces anulatus]|uniref:sigma factor-like helix-turn-helix DNA-binding protein n=1 Tax=Streptomyces anulatus TaxID=1892 RepID=UPI0027E22F67|nr:sigma factor-like helix-turn-helix DNA-binding protein [Streptomyces anulatus]